jgi:tRNA-specific 2-thiouridylase
VAAHLLKEQGHEVIGMFMRNWHDDSVILDAECPWIEDSNDALLVAQHLNIPFQVIDLSKEYKERIVDYMFAEYEAGRTPNPDVLCNREIKFDIFLKAAIKLKADFVATGHYVRKETIDMGGKPVHRLLAGADPNKDQSYFLCQLTQDQLAKALFPIGELQKPEVRRIAKEIGLPTAEKKDSQGLCFVGKIRLPDFLQQQLEPKAGRIIEVPADSPVYQKALVTHEGNSSSPSLSELAEPWHYAPSHGEVIGEHQGAHFFTIGQRKGLGVGGKVEPLFVIDTDVDENIVYVGKSDSHPGLYRSALFVSNEELHWVRPDKALIPGESRRVMARIRYRQPLQAANLEMRSEGLYVVFDKPQRGVTPGQFVAWHEGDEAEELVGSGVIA